MVESIIDGLADLFAATVGIEPVAAIDGEGTIIYGASVDRKCRIGGEHRLVRDRNGREQLSTVQLWMAGDFGLTADDRYTLPAGFDPQQPKAINVRARQDENGAHHQVVFFF